MGWPFSFDVEPLMAPWIFVAGRIKEGALSERSEFGSFPSPRHKSKEGVAISGAPFFCLLFFGKTKKSESVPAGNEREMDHQAQLPIKPNQRTRIPGTAPECGSRI